MKSNIGKTDRFVRLALGVACLIAALLVNIPWLDRVFLVAAGVLSIYEAVVGWCAFYALIGKNTCPIKYEKK